MFFVFFSLLSSTLVSTSSLKAAAFGYIHAVLETVKTEAEFKERVVENCMSWIKQQIFDFLCPGLAFRPEQALQSIKQCFLYSNDNEARLTMNQYLTNCLKASECLTKSAFELDLALYVADNMDPAVKTHMESGYKGHYKPRARDWKTEMKAFREPVKHAATAEDKVLSLRKEACRNTTAALANMPGFNASALASTADGSNPALRSVAEETITRHKRIEPFDWQSGDCYGCGGAHKYLKFGKINCVNADRPGCKENAEKNKREHQEMTKARQDDYDRRDYARRDYDHRDSRDRRPPRKGPFEGEKDEDFTRCLAK